MKSQITGKDSGAGKAIAKGEGAAEDKIVK